MCKNGLKKYMLLKKEDGEEVSIYRVLELVEEKVLVMDCVKKVMPVWKSVEELDAYVEVEENINTDTLAPTGSGKSYSLLSRAKELVKKNKDSRVIIALPSRALTMQVGKQKGVCSMMAGDKINPNAYEYGVCQYPQQFHDINDYWVSKIKEM